MKERQRWRPEEDALLQAYVNKFGAQEWGLVSQRMGAPFARAAKSCLERWKNYLRPGLKKGPLSDEEQRLVLRLQAKHGNQWKKIAAEVPGRSAKRLGKWWEVFQEKQRRLLPPPLPAHRPLDHDRILQTFAEKLVARRRMPPPSPPPMPWLPSPSVALTLSPTAAAPELVELCREVEEGLHAWAAHRAEAAWRLRRVELQLEADKACIRREKTEEVEALVRALREEQAAAMEKIDEEFRDQLAAVRRDAELKEQKLVDQWAGKHAQLVDLLRRMTRRRNHGEDGGVL